MIETAKRTKRLFRIFSQTRWELSGYAVLEGNNPGRVWIDQEDDPHVAIMKTPEGILLAGDPKSVNAAENLRTWFEDEFIPGGNKSGLFGFEIYFDPEWRDVAEFGFKSRTLIAYPRMHLLIDRQSERMNPLPPLDGFQSREITPGFLKEARGYKNIEHIDCWIKNNWGDINTYREKGFGYCYIYNRIIVSWSVSDCLYQDCCEIGIETDPAFRKRGIATRTVNLILDHAFENGIREVGWQCPAHNHGSVRTAQRTGFKLEREYTGYEGYYDRARHILIQGFNELYHRKSVSAAIDHFEHCLEAYPANPKVLYDLASGFAQAGSVDRAFEALSKAIRLGFQDVDHIMNNEHLSALRADPRWKEIKSLVEP